ncbi:phosphate/phosphite/phosphonate ABC transporter substrate-binding protein [Desulfonatronovibrio hydrogenovorans]|uniref:phosphate/phosphite/phosphonate ABC transporter substrate-binding protein n=1 Tax=Desulfonatronovibrio hydrogenovorans TaxID=53245 RepID=UPI0005502924|nr:phosphate/phosphite/phosphonate ABC transporter substrate-binding protein [Desulfonatronovibrio hydrogenovorans]
MRRSLLVPMVIICLIFGLSISGKTNPRQSLAAERPQKLVMTAIPDDSAENMREFFGLIAKHIENTVGIPTEYVHVSNYAASVTALATGQADLAWFGAVTTAQAYIMMEDELEVVAARDIDKGFIGYFIANADANIPEVSDLAELAELAQGKNWTFTFGSKSSTSSHLMPRSFFTDQSGKNPEEIFRTVAYSGSHDVVLQKVANGEFHLGALGQPPYDRASDNLKEKAPIIYTTPKFTNYNFSTRKALGRELIDEIHAALMTLHESPEGKKALEYLGSEGFVDADMSEWMGYVNLIRSGIDIGG